MRSRDVDQTRVRDVVAVVLAGGKGARLDPLTRDRAKPAVPFGGSYRIIDFVLSNCVNSGLRRVLLLTQYKASSLDRHLNLGWHRLFCRDLGEFLDVLPPQQRVDENWYLGTADAVYQNIYSLEMAAPRLVIVLAGDHIYKMNYHGSRRGRAGAELPREGRRSPGHSREPGHVPGVDGHLLLQRPVPARAVEARRQPPVQQPRLRPRLAAEAGVVARRACVSVPR